MGGQIEKETIFDDYYNMTLVQFYTDNEIQREMKYEYEFDKKGNWIKRNIYLIEKLGNEKKTLVLIETRKIQYFE